MICLACAKSEASPLNSAEKNTIASAGRFTTTPSSPVDAIPAAR
jgi:hypothetical protein